ncbi:Transcriptional regulatory protein sin3, partial [Blyttiomyces sp. JEL0837]
MMQHQHDPSAGSVLPPQGYSSIRPPSQPHMDPYGRMTYAPRPGSPPPPQQPQPPPQQPQQQMQGGMPPSQMSQGVPVGMPPHQHMSHGHQPQQPSGSMMPGGPPPPQHMGAPGMLTLSQQSVPAPLTVSTSGPQPPRPTEYADQANNNYRPLNVKDALTYLDQVKNQFHDQPEVYNRFLDIMKDFKSQSIDTPGVIDRVSTLFRGHPSLITGFNTFLPPGYRIEATSNPLDPIRVITPQSSGQGLAPHEMGQIPPVQQPPPHPHMINQAPQQPPNAMPPVSALSGHPTPPQGAPQPPMQSGYYQGPPPMAVYTTGPPPVIGQGPGYQPMPPGHLGNIITPQQGQQPPPSGYQPAGAPMHGGPVAPIVSPASGGPPSLHVQSQPPPGQTPPPPNNAAAANGNGGNKKAPVEFNHAINYVNKIKNRFSAEPETYKQFLEILQTYQKESKPIQEVYGQVQGLFKNAPDLLDEFKQFLPDVQNQARPPPVELPPPRMPPVGNFIPSNSAVPRQSGSSSSGKKSSKRSAPSSSAPTAGPSISAMAGIQQQLGSGIPPPGMGGVASLTAAAMPIGMQGQGQPPSKKRAKTGSAAAAAANAGSMGGVNAALLGSASGAAATAGSVAARPDTIEELEWIDRCKRTIGNKATYNEFLKVLNLFSQEIIDAKTLVERVEPFLSKAPDLFEWFKKFVKYEEDQVVREYYPVIYHFKNLEFEDENTPAERPELDLRSCRRVGHSYRLLPDTHPRPICSGRDDLCREVLNDDWISQPEYVSETGFVSHKKTQYEEALHKCEEERYEFDLNIEANLHTIALLEPLYRKIQNMTNEERSRFKLEEGLGGSSKTIYKRVIKKIYDNERGQEVIDALHNSPAVAVPVVLKRLKQKDEEWKRCQRDWNKVWREIDAKNYYKALDHQGISFKANDRKAISSKTLVTEIDMIYREQKQRRQTLAHASRPTMSGGFTGNNSSLLSLSSVAYTRYQLDFKFSDPTVFRDARKMIMTQVSHTSAISHADEERIGEFLSNFVRRFFFVENFDDGALDRVADDIDDANDDGAASGGEESVNGSGNGDVSDSNDATYVGASGSGGGGGGANGAGRSSKVGLRKEVLIKRAEAAKDAMDGVEMGSGGSQGESGGEDAVVGGLAGAPASSSKTTGNGESTDEGGVSSATPAAEVQN